MNRPKVRIYTSIDSYIDREMNDTEFAQYEIDQAQRAAEQAQAEEKATARQALLDKLGITADEAKLLLGGN